MLEKNKIYCGDHIELMKEIDDGSIDLTITSPPYDNLRTYEGYTFDYKALAHELFRVTKEGGVVVWVVGDQTIKGSETGTSFEQALYFKKNVGFNLHDTMIYMKDGLSFPDTNRYQSCFEYMFVFSKMKPKTIHLISDRKNVSYGRKVTGTDRKPNGTTRKASSYGIPIKKYGIRWNVWEMNNTSSSMRKFHPAIFPEKLANDHIISWSNEGDLIFDPMCGSGTTCKMARMNNRDYIGIDISEKYCEIARERLLTIPITLKH